MGIIRLKNWFVTHGIVFLLSGFFLLNIILAYLLHFSIIAATCMTVQQVQTDARCLFILSGKVYQMGSRTLPHQSHPCGTDVTSIVPLFHLQTPANYLLPNYIADICSPSPNGPSFTLTVFLHGIGLGGDNANAVSTGNNTPLHLQRPATVTLRDGNNNAVATELGYINYASQSGNYTGTVTLGSVPNGTYSVSIASNSFLKKAVPVFFQVQQSGTYPVPPVYLTAGDINNDAQLDVLDYNTMIGCFGSKQKSSACTQGAESDLNDDGVVDGIDYNLFLRELSVQKGG